MDSPPARAVPLSVVRTVVALVCLMGIVGMIVGSVADNNNGAVVTFGLISAVAILVLMAFTLAGRSGPEALDEQLAAELESRIQAMMERGVPEAEIRDLVGDAVRLGRSRGPR